jgi:hypothetical protein
LALGWKVALLRLEVFRFRVNEGLEYGVSGFKVEDQRHLVG